MSVYEEPSARPLVPLESSNLSGPTITKHVPDIFMSPSELIRKPKNGETSTLFIPHPYFRGHYTFIVKKYIKHRLNKLRGRTTSFEESHHGNLRPLFQFVCNVSKKKRIIIMGKKWKKNKWDQSVTEMNEMGF